MGQLFGGGTGKRRSEWKGEDQPKETDEKRGAGFHLCGPGEHRVRALTKNMTILKLFRSYYRRRDLEDPFFSEDFQQICIRILQNFGKISLISLKYENLAITLSEIIEILRNSGQIRQNLTKSYKICCLLRKSVRIASKFARNSAKVLKNQRNLEWCKGKKK